MSTARMILTRRGAIVGTLFEQARAFAIAAHGDQKYGEHPYSVHLDDVDAVLLEFGFSNEMLRAAGQLHDVVEDTSVTLDDLREQFPGAVLYVIDRVTSIAGPNRKARNRLTYPRIAGRAPCLIVKLADHIANVRRSKAEKCLLLEMYGKEYPQFRKALYTHASDVAPAMWAELDRLMEWAQ
jgi:(p)ppGpp synthase/HD superfamily hydrolase